MSDSEYHSIHLQMGELYDTRRSKVFVEEISPAYNGGRTQPLGGIFFNWNTQGKDFD